MTIQDRKTEVGGRAPVYLEPCISGDQMDPEGGETELFIITPTYTRQEQEAELTRLGQTLLLAGNITCNNFSCAKVLGES